MKDYTGPHDYFDRQYVREWAETAGSKRPFRVQFFQAFVDELNSLPGAKVLDLGAGPGFLAEYVLARCDLSSYHLFDLSPHMLEIGRERLASFAGRVQFHQGSFTDEGWWEGLPAPFDAVISLQAVHEVMGAERIARLYREVGTILRPGGVMAIADKLDYEGEKGTETLEIGDHEAAIKGAGLEEYRKVLEAGDLIMFTARRPRS